MHPAEAYVAKSRVLGSTQSASSTDESLLLLIFGKRPDGQATSAVGRRRDYWVWNVMPSMTGVTQARYSWKVFARGV